MENNHTQITPKEEPKTGGYQVENVILLESEFHRSIFNDMDITENNINNEISVVPEAHATSADNKFVVSLTLEYKGKQNDFIVCSSKIKMLGIFEKIGEPFLNEDAFKNVNAPAIIYPFIREHLHSLSLKAGITNILLPTVNFKV